MLSSKVATEMEIGDGDLAALAPFYNHLPQTTTTSAIGHIRSVRLGNKGISPELYSWHPSPLRRSSPSALLPWMLLIA